MRVSKCTALGITIALVGGLSVNPEGASAQPTASNMRLAPSAASLPSATGPAAGGAPAPSGSSVGSQGPSKTFSIVDLGPLSGDDESHALAINAGGAVAGWSKTSRGWGGDRRPVVWLAGTSTKLAHPDMGGGGGEATAINDASVVGVTAVARAPNLLAAGYCVDLQSRLGVYGFVGKIQGSATTLNQRS